MYMFQNMAQNNKPRKGAFSSMVDDIIFGETGSNIKKGIKEGIEKGKKGIKEGIKKGKSCFKQYVKDYLFI